VPGGAVGASFRGR